MVVGVGLLLGCVVMDVGLEFDCWVLFNFAVSLLPVLLGFCCYISLCVLIWGFV